ncbi:hypothetical protein Hanom_Chr15g01338181 [Helianthus anomalus]
MAGGLTEAEDLSNCWVRVRFEVDGAAVEAFCPLLFFKAGWLVVGVEKLVDSDRGLELDIMTGVLLTVKQN